MFHTLRLPTTALIRIGSVALLLAIAVHRFVHPGTGLSAQLIDGADGFLYGVAIACLLAAASRGRRQGPGESGVRQR